MTFTNQKRGRLGEEIAALLLVSRGYREVARNARFGRGEIDLLLERGELLVAVEVKWRRSDTTPEAAVRAWSPMQRARAHAAVLAAMESLPGAARRPWRLDLVTIEVHPRGWTVEHHPGAWSPGRSYW